MAYRLVTVVCGGTANATELSKAKKVRPITTPARRTVATWMVADELFWMVTAMVAGRSG